MPIIRSAKKRMRQNEIRRVRNRGRRTRLRSVVRKLNEAIAVGDPEAVKSCWSDTQALLDHTARLGIIHRNTAARTKSRLSRRVNAVLSA